MSVLDTKNSKNSKDDDDDDDVSEKLPKITKCRFAERRDLRKISKLLKCRTLNLFPDAQNLISLYEKSCLALVQENELEQVVSAMLLCNYPNVPALSQSAWPSWLDKLYDVKDASSSNTLFIHLVVWDEIIYHQRDCLLVDLLAATFYAVGRCDYVVLVVPPSIEPADSIRQVMTRVAPKSESNEVDAQVLYVGDRRQFVPQMKFRLVVEEDNDDVIQLLDNDTTLLREFYGDYYSSELSRHPDPWRQLVIADTMDDRVAAVACLNQRIDLELLNDRFELSAFDNLKKRILKFASSFDDSEEEYEDYPFRVYNEDNEPREAINTNDVGIEFSRVSSDDSDGMEEHSSISDDTGDAFALELLGFRWDDEAMLQASSRDILVAAFECFPQLRYCLALMPTDRRHFPFLDLFTRVPLKADKDFPMALYVIHRASVHSILAVRELNLDEDRQSIYHLLDHSQNILDDFNEALKNDEYRFYVFTCNNIIAGLAIVCTEIKKEVDRLFSYYRLENLLGTTSRHDQAAVRLLRLSLAPIFQPSSGFFLSEVMRLEACDTIFYRWTMTEIEDSPPSCLSIMQACEPRIRNWPQFQRFFDKEYDDTPFEQLFSLYVTSPRLATMTKRIVNVKIVVVGASDCGLAFIDSFASGYKYRDLQFTDITLISMNGLSYEHSNDYVIRTMIPYRGRYCYNYRTMTSARVNYNVVKGTVVGINRKKQKVYLEDSSVLSYDYLVLTCGLLYQLPEFAEEEDHDDDGEFEVPSNYLTINDDVDAVRCLEEIKRRTKNFTVEKSIIFHGCNVQCYCALASFLELGLDGSWITLIEPKPLSNDIFNGDPEIRDQLHEIITKLGVKLLSGYDLADWKLDSSTSTSRRRIVSVSLLRENNNDDDDNDDDVVGPFVNCDILIGFHAKSPCRKTFLAIARAGLVFDGRLVIDAEFRTNDRRIFAAGTMTKYSRRLRAEQLEHKYFDSLEVGEKLADKFVSIIMANGDETTSSENKFNARSAVKLPEFQAPIIISCILPGGYRYLHVRKPGNGYQSDQQPRYYDDDDDVFTTGSCTADTGYFRLRLNQFRALECVTCFGQTDYDIQKVIALYGKHEALFDDLKNRFLNSEISDFHAYFSEPWATALFSDDFDDFCLTSKHSSDNVISNEVENNGENLFRELLNSLKIKPDNEKTEDDDRRIAYENQVKDQLIAYLERHEDQLPMYSTPEKRRRILEEIADRPLLLNRDNACQSSSSSSLSSPCSCISSITNSKSNENYTAMLHVLESSSDFHCNSSRQIVLT